MKGVLLLNTGSPHSLSKKDVQWFIGEMLSDPLVMSTVPDWFRTFLAKKIIAPLRAPKSLAHYSLIWGKHTDSPIIHYSKVLAKKIENESGLPVEIAMRYGMPEIDQAFKNLLERAPTLHEVVVFPMFPHYAESSYKTAVNEAGKCYMKIHYPFRLKIIEPFFDQPPYIKALAERISPFIKEGYDRIVFSFHSLPLTHVETGWSKGHKFDYVYQIKETIKLLSKELDLDQKKSRITYSSAMGRKWLEPDLCSTLKDMAKEGIKNVVVLTPGFPTDNLESLYDIDIVAKEVFLKNGGEKFSFVPGLNAEKYWVEAIIRILTSKA